jgi:predicted CoA-binding protein
MPHSLFYAGSPNLQGIGIILTLNCMDNLTVILGASPQPERYSYLAFRTLAQKGLPSALVNPNYQFIEGTPVFPSLSQVPGPVGTVSMYLSADRQPAIAEALVALRPGRVIFNPGSENPGLKTRLQAAGIACLEACTLVLLRTGQF